MSSSSLSPSPLSAFTTDLISHLATLTNSALDGVVASIFTYYTHHADTEVQDLNKTISALQADKIELRHQLLQHQIQNGQTISELRAEKMELSQQVQVLQAQLQTQDWRMVTELREEMEGLRGELRERDGRILGLEEKYDQSELRAEMENLRVELKQRDVQITGLEENYDRLARDWRVKWWCLIHRGPRSPM